MDVKLFNLLRYGLAHVLTSTEVLRRVTRAPVFGRVCPCSCHRRRNRVGRGPHRFL